LSSEEAAAAAAAAGMRHQPTQRVVTVGVIADLGVPCELAEKLAGCLAEDLAAHVDPDVTWRVRVRCETLPLDSDGHLPFQHHTQRLLRDNGWDYVVCLTELPRRTGTRRALLFEVDRSLCAALVSVPAMGAVRLRAHARWTLVRVLHELTGTIPQSEYGTGADGDGHRRRGRVATEMLSPVRELPGEPSTKAALAGLRGQLRLLAGMVRVNKPWRLVPSLSSAIAAAVATAAFGVFYSSIWVMADAAGPLRLTLVTVFAVVAMVTWLIAYNSLWERRGPGRDKQRTALYNAATVVTLTIGVLCMYVLLFAFTLVASLVVIEPGYLSEQLRHAAGLTDYLSLAWLASSMGTVAGALGSTLEGEDAVRRATYGRRELERRARREDADPGAGDGAP
jgi:hypothetical protein